MQLTEIQEACERGQELLIKTEYGPAELALVEAERAAWALRDFDALSRLYMPLQECRRQRRQKCLEGAIRLDIIARSPEESLNPREIVEKIPRGTLLVAGYRTVAPAIDTRRIQYQRQQYAETFLATVDSTGDGLVVTIVPFAVANLTQEHSITLRESELGEYSNPAKANALWERLHMPFLQAADRETDPMKKIDLYRRTIEVDYGCELAHQNLSDVARRMARGL